MKRMWLLVVALLLLLGGLVAGWASGPWLAMRGIDRALAERSPARLERHIDFPTLRINLKAQLADRITRSAGEQMQANRFGALATLAAGKLAGAGVDTVVTPAGLASLLHGQGLVRRASGHTETADTWSGPAKPKPFAQVDWRYQSLDRFTATRTDADGHATVFVFARQGLRWRLVDITLPPGLELLDLLN
jgi:hypothetical protein